MPWSSGARKVLNNCYCLAGDAYNCTCGIVQIMKLEKKKRERKHGSRSTAVYNMYDRLQ